MWYLTFSVVVTVTLEIVFAILLRFPSIIECSFEYSLVRYDAHVRDYRIAQCCGQPQTVLVGPSYAAILDNFSGISNLAFGSARPLEIERLISTLSSNDIILYAFGPQYFQSHDLPSREFPFSTLVRRELFLRFVLSGSSIMGSPVANREEYFDNMLSFIASLPDETLLSTAKECRNLHDRFPNVRFVLFPIIPNPPSDARMTRLRDLLIDAELPVIDLTGTLSRDDFSDIWHANTSGRRKLQVMLTNLTRSEPKPPMTVSASDPSSPQS